jgi:uncharacterized protein (TIGR03435 family)
MMTANLLSAVGVHLWQSTLFAAIAVVVLATLLRGREARIRYAVWLAASLKFLVPFAALMSVGAAIGSIRPGVAPMPEPIRVIVKQATVMPPALMPRTVAATAAAPLPIASLLMLLWAAGIAVVIFRWIREWRRVQRYVDGTTRIGTFDGLPVLSSERMRDERCEPGLFGFVRPVVLVPDGIAERLTPEQFRAVLAHESCHARRRDNLAAAVHSLVEAIFWFHPGVWWLGRRLREERERACDEAVVARGVNADTYAAAILSTCRFYVESHLFAVAGISGADLRRRIEGIVTGRTGQRLTPVARTLLAVAALASLATPVLLGTLTMTLWAQTGNSFTGLQTSMDRKFDVASIKVNRSGDSGWRLSPPARGDESITNLELRKIVASAFRIQDKMVFGPDWMDTIRYDIEAKGDRLASNPEVWEMMRSLLADRFHLKYHIETREIPAYVLVIGGGGHKLVKGEEGVCAEPLKSGNAGCDALQFLPFGMAIHDMPVNALAAGLARRLQDRPVVDRTGLPGRWDATVLWREPNTTEDQIAQVPKDMRPPDVNMFEAFEQQAGLKLDARREPVEVLVVDHIDPADEN